MFDDDDGRSPIKRAMGKALLAIALIALLWWFLEDRPSPLSGLAGAGQSAAQLHRSRAPW